MDDAVAAEEVNEDIMDGKNKKRPGQFTSSKQSTVQLFRVISSVVLQTSSDAVDTCYLSRCLETDRKEHGRMFSRCEK